MFESIDNIEVQPLDMNATPRKRLTFEVVKTYSRQLILSFYLAWYVYIAGCYFDPNHQLWLNALAIALVVGIALNASASKGNRSSWATIRLFLIPFAVSSYTALTKGKDFVLIFPSNTRELATGISISLLFSFCYLLFLNAKSSSRN